MSRAHVVAPLTDVERPYRARRRTPGAGRKPIPTLKEPDTCYLERAMLLWPRLDRARVRKIGDNPARIAELVSRRTSQPYEAILAMLTRQSASLMAPTESTAGFDSGRTEAARIALRIVRTDAAEAVEQQELVPA
jgi:hypothetical protein